MSNESVRRAIRTFVISFLTIAVPGSLGWLHDMTEWASSQGQHPFPDAHSLAFVGVSAVLAGATAVVNLIWNMVEDATGKGLLRTPKA